MRNADRRRAQAVGQDDFASRRDLANRDVLERHEPAPGLVLAQELRHGGRAVDGDVSRAEDFAAELGEAQVVADVRMREQDAVRTAAETLDLVGEVRCGVDEKSTARGRVDEAEGRDAPPLGRVGAGLDAERLAASGVGHAPILRDPQDDGVRAGRLGARSLQSKDEERRGEQAARTVDCHP